MQTKTGRTPIHIHTADKAVFEETQRLLGANSHADTVHRLVYIVYPLLREGKGHWLAELLAKLQLEADTIQSNQP